MHLVNMIVVDDDGPEVDIFMDNDVAAEEPANADVENRDRMELRPRNRAELRPKPAKPVRYSASCISYNNMKTETFP